MRLPNSLFRLLGGLLVLFLFSSCSSAWYMANNNYNNDPIYGIVESTGDTIKIDVLDSEWDINRKFRFDNKFRWNYSMCYRPRLYRYQDFFWRNRMLEMVLDSHLGISIGIDITFGGIGRGISFQ